MVDAAEDEESGTGGTATPPLGSPPPVPYDKTIKLDRAIAERNLSVPSRFGRYEVIERIGIGGFASVYSARDPELDATVAIKVLAENHSADVEVRKRFVAEARVARRLGGDRLIGVFDLGETDDGRPYVVMELASGGTLRARLQRIGRPSPASLLRLIDELGACMHAVHQKGVIHRDIKPSNLLLRVVDNAPDGRPTELIEDHERVVLADFGLARDISAGASAITVGGGTAGYMAPEQADPNGKADVRADIYAATVVLAELTTGRHPERLDLATAPISEPVRAALEQGLAIDREQRPPSAMAWRDALRTAYEAPGPARAGTAASQTVPLESGGGHADAPPDRQAERSGMAHGHDEHDPTLAIVHHDVELTAPIDATRVRPPHQFRDDGDAEYDEAGLETPVPAAVAPPDSGGHDEPGDPMGPADPSAPTRHLDDSSHSDTQSATPHRTSADTNTTDADDDDLADVGDNGGDNTAILPDGEIPGGKPRTFVRPVVDREPPPPPPSIPLSARAQRPPPSAQPITPPAGTRPPPTDRPEVAATAPVPNSGQNHPARPAAQQPASQPAPAAPRPVAEQRPMWQPPPPSTPPPPAPTPVAPSADVATRGHGPERAAHHGPIPAPATAPIAPQQAPPGSPPRGHGGGSPPASGPGPIQGQPPGQTPGRPAPPPTPAQVKQQRREVRRWERRRRWRRRRRRLSNFVRALIRGVLALVVMSIVAAVVVAATNGEQVNALSADSERIVNLVGLASFFLGLRLFPWPRRLDPSG